MVWLETHQLETLICTSPASSPLFLIRVCTHSLSSCSSWLQSQGHHDHSKGSSSHSGDLATAFDGVWKGLTALAGIYLLFIIEHCIGMFKHYKDHEVRDAGAEDASATAFQSAAGSRVVNDCADF